MFRYVVLGLLSDDVPRHGYALMKAYRERVGVKMNTGKFYRELQRLVAAGLVRNVVRTGEGDRRQAPYEITEAGLATFKTWFADPGIGNGGISQEDQLSARVMFLADVDSEAALRVIAQWQDELWMRAKLLERAHGGAQGASQNRAGFPVLPLVLARRLRHVTADIAFLDDLRAAYDRWLECRKSPTVREAAIPATVAEPGPRRRAADRAPR